MPVAEAASPCRCNLCGGGMRPGRRALLRTGLAGFGAGLLRVSPSHAREPASPDAALGRMMDGNARFVAQRMSSFAEDLAILRKHTAAAQSPFAALLSCADSRVPVELIFDQTIGQLFVARTAGNLAATDMIASLEYAAAVLGVQLVMVLGHAGCGAVGAAIKGSAVPGQISGLFPYLRSAIDAAGPDLDATIKANARIQARLLAEASPVIRDLARRGSLKVVAGYYDPASGAVTAL